MKLIADLHIHSFYSRATSKELTFEHLYKWALLKGVNVVVTGDIAHPGWLEEMKEKLVPAEEGLFRLKKEYTSKIKEEIPAACDGTVRFIAGGEISNIYKKNEKVRKNHNLVFMPTFEAVRKFQDELDKIGNIRSDGRPILGLDARDLLEIVLNNDEQGCLIPAHIWTPWFSVLGSKSGFDTIEECFGDLSDHIFAVETGLSSDPPMNWRLSQLDKYTLVSNSDAHSPQKLAREANILNVDLSYSTMFDALKSGDKNKLGGTIEFFPEEGKYHYDGHRKCGIRWDPKTTLENNCICTVCGKPVTVGVSHRVETLADRDEGIKPANGLDYKSLIPLPEVLGEVFDVGTGSKKVIAAYNTLLAKLGPELSILQDIPIEDVKSVGGELLAEGIKRMREGKVTLAGGYDGEFGVIKLFEENERAAIGGQSALFRIEKKPLGEKEKLKETKNVVSAVKEDHNLSLGLYKEPETELSRDENEITYNPETGLLSSLNDKQKEAAAYTDTHLKITAGPGTGKTKTLTHRIAYLVKVKSVDPGNILAVTFTNKAAGEMRDRLRDILSKFDADKLTIKTFHSLAAGILRDEAESAGVKPGFTICSQDDPLELLRNIFPDESKNKLKELSERISKVKCKLLLPGSVELRNNSEYDSEFISDYKMYQSELANNNILDLDDLILNTVKLFEHNSDVSKKYRNKFRWISVDEYQDINHAQFVLIKLLTQGGNNLCVIGDPDQAIYGFRGSSREYFLEFDKRFPSAKHFQLNKNYRSTSTIVNASGQVIIKDTHREMVNLLAQNEERTKLEVYTAQTYKAEAEYIVHQIEKAVGGTSYFSINSGRVDDEEFKDRSFADFAVLYRLGAQSKALVEAFERSGIPYQCASAKRLSDYPVVKDILDCLWIVFSSDAVFHHDRINRKYGKVLQRLDQMHREVGTISVAEMIEKIKVFLSEFVSYGFNKEQNEQIHKLVRIANPYYNNLKDFLESASLQGETDEYDIKADRVKLMSLHASKGLEFPVVYISGCEENLLPYKKENEPTDLDEERRLFYVGMTRAKEKLVLTHARKRFLFGKTYQYSPSRFINDIESALKDLKKAESFKSPKSEDNSEQLGLF